MGWGVSHLLAQQAQHGGVSLGSLVASTERLGHTYLKQIQEVRPSKDGAILL